MGSVLLEANHHSLSFASPPFWLYTVGSRGSMRGWPQGPASVIEVSFEPIAPLSPEPKALVLLNVSLGKGRGFSL